MGAFALAQNGSWSGLGRSPSWGPKEGKRLRRVPPRLRPSGPWPDEVVARRGAIWVRRVRASDLPALARLSAKAFPGMAPWTEGALAEHLRRFPQGQLVAIGPQGQPVGLAIGLLRSWRPRLAHASWAEATGGGSLSTHEADGNVLYAAEVAVDPDWQGHGVGAALYEGRRALARRWGLLGIVAGGRLPGLRRRAKRFDAWAYAQAVHAGRVEDPVLGFQLAQGFTLCGVIEGYLPEDAASLGHASLLFWPNPEAQGQLSLPRRGKLLAS